MTQLNFVRLVPAILIVMVVSSCAFAQSSTSYRIERYSINSGGGAATSASYVVKGTLGQGVAGYCASASYRQWIGFWVPDDAAATAIGSIDKAKTFPDGTPVSVTGKIAASNEADFSGFFYIEESDRSSGIRVAPISGTTGLVRGSVVDVVGIMDTVGDEERQIANAAVTLHTPVSELSPLGMNNRTLGGADFGTPPDGQYGATGGAGLNNVGLLVKAFGQVTGSGSGYIIIDDGSGVTVKVNTAGLSGVPTSGMVTVVGLMSLDTGKVRYILPRDRFDITP